MPVQLFIVINSQASFWDTSVVRGLYYYFVLLPAISFFKSNSTQNPRIGIKEAKKYLIAFRIGHLYSTVHITSITTNMTTKKPWIDPAILTASGMSARYFKGIAIKNKQMVEIASQSAICLNILNITINCIR